MSDDRHDEIAARLRAEAGARAPERLQADVMLRVHAEPRPRRIRRRRPSWQPLGSLAAAACVLAALVFGISHLSLSGGGSASEGGGATFSAAERQPGAGAAGGNALGLPKAPYGVFGRPGLTGLDAAAHTLSDQKLLEYQAAAARAPGPLRAAVLGRLVLDSSLPKALGPLHLHRGRGSH
jgi:hypothetical protein